MQETGGDRYLEQGREEQQRMDSRHKGGLLAQDASSSFFLPTYIVLRTFDYCKCMVVLFSLIDADCCRLLSAAQQFGETLLPQLSD